MSRKLVVGITQGDGNGIGYEVIIKALADERILELCTPVIYGSSKIFGFYKKHIHNIDQINTNVISSAKDVHQKRVNIVNCLPENVFVEPGQPTAESAKSAMTSLERAVEDIKAGHIDVLVTAPINKRAMVAEGFSYTGHTEYLEKEFGVDEVAMIMVCDRLKVGVVTGHIPLKEVCSSLTSEKILKKLRLMKASLERDFCIDAPKIAVLGLNPHCGDGGLLGDEEQQIILPAVQAANEEGIMLSVHIRRTVSSVLATIISTMQSLLCTTIRDSLHSRLLPLRRALTILQVFLSSAHLQTMEQHMKWRAATLRILVR